MHVHDRIRAVNDLLSVEKLNDAQRNELRPHLDELIVTSEGMDFIQRKIDGKRFHNRKPFLTAIVRSLNNRRDTVAAEELQKLQKLAASVAKGTTIKEGMHWSSLVFLQETKYFQTGNLLRDELRRLPSVKKEGRVPFGEFDWKHISIDQRASLLDEAKRAATDREFQNVLDNAIRSMRLGIQRPEASTATAEPGPSSRPIESEMAEAQAKVDQSDIAVRKSIAPSDDETGHVPEPTALSSKSELSPESETHVRLPTIGTLDECLGIVAQAINAFVSSECQKVRAVREEVANLKRAKADADKRRKKFENEIASLEEETDTLRDHSHEADAVNERRLKEIEQLQENLAETRRELGEATSRSQQLSHRLEEARRGAEEAETRANDYIHQANLEREHAIQTFRVKVWNRVKPYLLEALDGETSFEKMGSDQLMFMKRLHQIVDALRDLEIARD